MFSSKGFIVASFTFRSLIKAVRKTNKQKKKQKNNKWHTRELPKGHQLISQQKQGRTWHGIFKVVKGKKQQPRTLYPARFSFRFNGEIKSFTQVKAKIIQHHKTSFGTNSKGTSQSRKGHN